MELTCMDTSGQTHSRYEADLFYCLRLEGKDSFNWLNPSFLACVLGAKRTLEYPQHMFSMTN